MNIENFEKRAQSEFEDFRPEVDTEKIWQNIEPHLKKKKKRRFLILFFWGLGGILLFLGLRQWYGVENKTLSAIEKGAAYSPKPAPHQPLNVGEDKHPAFEKRSSKPHQTPETFGPAEKHTTPKAANQSAHEPRCHSEMADATAIAPMSSIAMAPLPNAQAPAQGGQSTLPQEKEPFISTPTPRPLDSAAAMLENKPDQNPGERKLTQPKNENQVVEKKKPAKAKNPSKIKPHKHKPSKQTLTLCSGLAIPIGVLKLNDQVEPNATLLANRKSSEKTLEAFTANMRYAYATKKGLMFLIGLDYKQLNERFKVSYTEKETQIITGVLTQTVDAAGQVLSQTTGAKEVTTTRIYSNIAYNQYQYLNLPIGMGYQRFKKESQWEITGGLDLNLWFHFDGTHYNAFGTPEALGDPWYPGVYKRNAGMGLWAAYGYSRNLSRNIRWQVSAKASLPFQNITSPAYALTQKFYTVGLQGGLIFNLIEETTSKHKKQK